MKQRRGFTIIEVLVVVGILMLLFAILLPSVRAARMRALNVVCTSNLHQIGIAMHSYLEDSNGYIPDLDEISPVVNGYIYPFYLYGGKKGLTLDVPPEERFLNAYVGDPEMFRCPLDQPADDFDMDHTYWDDAGNSYLLNTQLPKNNIRLKIFKELMPMFKTEPSRVIMVAEEVAYNWLYGYDRGVRWHDATAPWSNVLFFDGHVKYMLMTPGLEGIGWTFIPTEALDRQD